MSLEKIFKFIVLILFLWNLRLIVELFQPLYLWLCDSLKVVTYWHRDFQAILALLVIGGVIVILLRIFNKL
jgi:hypothetical protein